MNEIAELWGRIVDWYRANAPTYRLRLAPPASPEDLRASEKRMGVELPDDVRASYRLYDGSAGAAIFPYGYYLLSLSECLLGKHLLMRFSEPAGHDADQGHLD